MLKPLRQWTWPVRQFIAYKIASRRSLERERIAQEREAICDRVKAVHSCTGLLAAAEAAEAQQNRYETVRLLRAASLCDAEQTLKFCLHHPVPELRQDYLMAQAGPGLQNKPRLTHLFRPCALLGHFQGQLSASQRAILNCTVQLHQKRWESGETPAPRQSGIGGESRPMEPLRGSVAIVMPRYIKCTPDYIDHDIGYHFGRSAAQAGLEVSYFEADLLTYRGSSELSRQLEKLDRFLAEKKPSLVVFDGNFSAHEKTIRAEHLMALKDKYKFSLINVLADWYDAMTTDYFPQWAEVSDLSVAFHHYSLLHDRSGKEKVLIWPTLPFSDCAFRGPSAEKRDLGLTYVGSSSRDRELFMDLAERSGVPTYCRTHNRLRREAPDHAELAEIFGRSKIIMNNGWVSLTEDIITARVGEAILSGALLLQEVGPPIDDYLVPFVHYAPFSNLHQFIALAQFFLEEEGLRERIARQAHQYWKDHYSSPQFWRVVFDRLQPRGR